MLVEEAQWIGNILTRYERAQISPMLNLGSGTRHFRTVVQPHIDRYIFEALSKRSIDVVHCDTKMEDGVDIEGDVFNPDCQSQLQRYSFRCILLTNVLEHVPSEYRSQFCKIMSAIKEKQSLLIITVPFSYPYHPDPIDTLFRPTTTEVAQMFPNFEPVSSALIRSNTYRKIFARCLRIKLSSRLFVCFCLFISSTAGSGACITFSGCISRTPYPASFLRETTE